MFENSTVLILLVAVVYIVFLGARGRKKNYRQKTDYAAEQLSVVMKSHYSKKRLMNKSEFKVFKIIEDEIKARRSGQRIFAQISLGEILEAEGPAYRAINSKRVDILIIDAYGNPQLAVEHQGRAHYAGNAAARDAVKREALRIAGIMFVETTDEDTEEDIRRKVYPLLGWHLPSSSPSPERVFAS